MVTIETADERLEQGPDVIASVVAKFHEKMKQPQYLNIRFIFHMKSIKNEQYDNHVCLPQFNLHSYRDKIRLSQRKCYLLT